MFILKVPDVTSKTRIEIDEQTGFAWKDLTSTEIFAGKRVVVFGLVHLHQLVQAHIYRI